MRAAVVFLVSLIVSGCAGQPDSPEAIAAAAFEDPVEPREVVCKKEKKTGSNRTVRVCREVPGVLDREQTRRDMSVLQRQSEQLK